MSFGKINDEIKDMARLAESLMERAGDEIPAAYRTAMARVISQCREKTLFMEAKYLGKGKLFNSMIAEKRSYYDRGAGKIYEVSFPHFKTSTFYNADFRIVDDSHDLSRIETVTVASDGNEFRLTYSSGGRYYAYTYNNRTFEESSKSSD